MTGPRSLSRRALLGAGAAGAAALAGCSGGLSLSFTPWAPTAGTWPLPRYDTTNTGQNPNATVPRESVEAAWTAEAVRATQLLVSAAAVVAGGAGGMAVVSRDDPTDVRVLADARTAVALGPPDAAALYGASYPLEAGAIDSVVRKWSDPLDTSSPAFAHEYNSGLPARIVPMAEAVFVGNDLEKTAVDRFEVEREWGRLLALDPAEGSLRHEFRGQFPAVAAGVLVATDFHAMRIYRLRSGFDAAFNGAVTKTMD